MFHGRSRVFFFVVEHSIHTRVHRTHASRLSMLLVRHLLLPPPRLPPIPLLLIHDDRVMVTPLDLSKQRDTHHRLH